jgi:hypothetical protein
MHVWGISNTLIEALFRKRVAISKFIYFFKMPISKAKLQWQVIFSHCIYGIIITKWNTLELYIFV